MGKCGFPGTGKVSITWPVFHPSLPAPPGLFSTTSRILNDFDCQHLSADLWKIGLSSSQIFHEIMGGKHFNMLLGWDTLRIGTGPATAVLGLEPGLDRGRKVALAPWFCCGQTSRSEKMKKLV